ncbi:MAG: stage II sporulation protein D [Bacilli bacterium]|nr:stage II sporulation protein D [Bacilli bacterium]
MNKKNVLYFAVLILIPLFVVSILYKTLINENKKNSKEYLIKISKNNEVLEIPLENYIIGVVAGEMPASFEVEALKAQAVASRTYAMYKIELNKELEATTDDQVYITQNEMKEKWGNDYNKYYNKIKNAVNETKNLVMIKDNSLFKSFYFSMSNGYTEDSITVFNEGNIKSVTSPWDNSSINKFIVTTEFKLDDIKTKLKLKEDIKNINILKRDKNNRVEEVKVNNKTYTGINFRHLLSLRSTDFEIKIKDNVCLITTKGYGHGVGMSQYGANGMAKEKYTYDEILKYYYQDIKLKNIEEIFV